MVSREDRTRMTNIAQFRTWGIAVVGVAEKQEIEIKGGGSKHIKC